MSDGPHDEAERQRLLLRALWRDAQAVQSLPARVQGGADAAARGLAAYRANAGAGAERALAAAFPTIAALVGGESFAALARDFWQHHAPQRGDLALWGEALPAFIAHQPSLADEPYLADSARLDWALHLALRAADAAPTAPDLALLAHADPAAIGFELAAGSALVDSPWPIATLWQAHQRSDAQRFDAVRAALQEQRAESAFVVRDGFAARVHALDREDAAFNRALLAGRSLADALDAASSRFAFDRWLARALSERWLAQVRPAAPSYTACPHPERTER